MENAEEPQARWDDSGSGGAGGAAGAGDGGVPSDAASMVVADVGYGSEAQRGEQPDEEGMTDARQGRRGGA